MKARKCDRCGKLYEEYKGIEVGERYAKIVTLRDGHNRTVSYDLCPNCMSTLIAWLLSKEKKLDKE